MSSSAVPTAERMKKSRSNATIIQVRLTPENVEVVERLMIITGKTKTELINWLIHKSRPPYD